MKKKVKCQPTQFALALIAYTAAATPVISQGFDPFDVGGGLLPDPTEGQTTPLQAGTGVVEGGGGAEADEQAGVLGSPNRLAEGVGPLFTARVSTGLTYEDADGDPSETYFGTLYDFGVFTQTRNQTFSFNVGAEARLSELESGLFNPFAQLEYTLANRATALGLDLTWRESDVGNQFLPADFDGDDLIVDGGTQEVHSARLRLETGRDGRFGTTTSLGFRQLDYTGTTDPTLVNQVTLDANTELRFSLDRRIEMTVFADWSQRTDDDAVQTVDTDLRVGVGLDLLIDRAWTANVELAFVEEETETTAGVVTDDGYDFTLALTRDLSNGTLAFTLDRDVLGTSEITTFDVARQMDLANGAVLFASVGVVGFDGSDLQPVFGLTYRNEILRGSVLSVSLDQTGDQDDDDTSILRTTLNGTFVQELTRVSRLSLTGALASVEEQNAAATNTLAVSLGLAYNHDLTEDWSLAARANTRINYEDGTRTDRENTFSIGLERTFTFRP